jgi:hypothetical protein
MPEEPLFSTIPPELDDALKVIHRYSVVLAKHKNLTPSEMLCKMLQITTDAPLNSTAKGTLTYYTAKAAAHVKKTLDEMMVANKDRYIDAKLAGKSKSTLYSIFSHGWMFLAERMDPDKIYGPLRDNIQICRERNGIALRFKADVRLGYTGESVDAVVTVPSFVNELILFLETSPDESKFEKDVNITDEQQDYVRDLCIGVPNVFIHTISQYKVLIMKSAIAARYATQAPEVKESEQ